MLRVLLVEDNPRFVEELQATLAEASAATAAAEAEACAWMDSRTQGCDVAIIDIFLKSGGGLASASTLPPTNGRQRLRPVRRARSPARQRQAQRRSHEPHCCGLAGRGAMRFPRRALAFTTAAIRRLVLPVDRRRPSFRRPVPMAVKAVVRFPIWSPQVVFHRQAQTLDLTDRLLALRSCDPPPRPSRAALVSWYLRFNSGISPTLRSAPWFRATRK